MEGEKDEWTLEVSTTLDFFPFPEFPELGCVKVGG